MDYFFYIALIVMCVVLMLSKGSGFFSLICFNILIDSSTLEFFLFFLFICLFVFKSKMHKHKVQPPKCYRYL